MGSSQTSSAMSDVPSAFNSEAKSGLLNALKNKLEGLSGRQLKKLLGLTPNAMERVDNLREIQSQYDVLEAKFFEEKAALEAKYKELYQPLFTKRYELINGESKVSDAQKEEAQKEDKGIPGFWLNALKNNDVIGDEIHESDEEVLKYLKDIRWSRTDEPKGFKLEFLFDTNPFFKNSVLTKSYHMIDEDDLILERAIGTEIEWYPGKCLTSKALGKKPKKMLKSVNPITKTEQCESFFHFFSPPDVPAEDVIIKEDAAEELQNVLELDYDIGSTIRDEIIPHAVSWFTGEAVENEYAYDDDDTDDEDDEDEDDEFIDDTTDDEEDEDEEDGDKDDEDEDSGKAKMEMMTPQGDGPQGEKPSEI